MVDMSQMKRVLWGLALSGNMAMAQSADNTSLTVLDRDFWTSPRAAAMAGALSPLADSGDAAYYNPAGIGGVQLRSEKNFLRTLDFPFFGVGANENSQDMIKNFGADVSSDTTVSQAYLDAYAGKRQYGRFSFIPKLGLGRTLFAYHYDTQIASVNQGAPNYDVDTHYRLSQGPGAGISLADRDNRFLLGVYAASLTRQETDAVLSWAELNDATQRKSVLNAQGTKYTALATNVGLMWRLAQTAQPTLAVVARDLGDTTYKASSGPGEDYKEQQDLTVGFRVSPSIGKWSTLHLVVEGARLSDDDIALTKKVRFGMEWTFGSLWSSDSVFALRGGVNHSGIAYGLGLNLGLINVQAASYAEDIGIGNARVIERRSLGVIKINIAAF